MEKKNCWNASKKSWEHCSKMNIVIAGYDVEGKSSYAYFQRKPPNAQLTIVDERELSDVPAGAEVHTGAGVFSDQFYDVDMVVRTAGLPPSRIKTSGKIWSATNEFFEQCPAPIIGVTGTKGKGTTCSLIASILRAAGKTVHLVGNIGVPSLDVLPQIQPDDIVVYELSSFQLWDLEKSPHVAVVLMIEPDHLDRHDGFADYLDAKAHIAQFQTDQDSIIYNKNNQFSQQIAAKSPARQLSYPIDLSVEMQHALKLPGTHNQENASAAVLVAKTVMPELSDDVICQGLAGFTGLPHRLKFVAEKRGVKFYDDSISTTPGSAVAALRSFQQPKVMLLGGADKGGDYTELAEELARSQSLRGVIVSGGNADNIAKALQKAGLPDATIVQKGVIPMTEVVQCALDIAQPGDVVILSPAAASFDQYANYTARGEAFVEAVAGI